MGMQSLLLLVNIGGRDSHAKDGKIPLKRFGTNMIILWTCMVEENSAKHSGMSIA